jgi:endoglucanase
MTTTARGLPGLIAALLLSVQQVNAAAGAVCYHGVNLSNAEYGDLGAVFGTNYIYPSEQTISYFGDKGMTIIRLPVRWEHLQPQIGGRLDDAELQRLKDTVSIIRKHGMAVLIDPHNFGYYDKTPLGTKPATNSAFAGFWARLAVEFANQDDVLFGLMNEPHDIKATDWLQSANAAIRGIRAVGAKNLIMVPGTAWTGAGTWEKDVMGGANGTVMLGIKDPADNYAYEFHQYLDADSSGTHPACDGAQQAIDAIANVTAWLKANNKRGFLGEFGVSSDPSCMQHLATILKEMSNNNDRWVGWSYWAAGEWWPPDYPFSVQPRDGKDRPQMSVLTDIEKGGPASRACAILKKGS